MLSQYLTAINCSGSLPAAGDAAWCATPGGGKFHLEMHWWHAAHFPMWGRPDLLERSLAWYQRILPVARETARRRATPARAGRSTSARSGARVPTRSARSWSGSSRTRSTFAELVYQARRDGAGGSSTSRELVEETAEFMAAFAAWDRCAALRARAAAHARAGDFPSSTTEPDVRARVLALGARRRAALARAARPRARGALRPRAARADDAADARRRYLYTETSTSSYDEPRWTRDHPSSGCSRHGARPG